MAHFFSMRRTTIALAASMMASASLASTSTNEQSPQTPDQEPTPEAFQWAEKCSANAFSATRLGQMKPGEAQGGLDQLVEAGEAEALSKVTTAEACLSIAASSYAKRPVFALKKGIRKDLGVADALIRTAPTLARQQSLAYKLDELQLDVLPPSVFEGKTYQQRKEIDPVAAKGHLHFYLATQIEQQARSGTYNLHYEGTCLIGIGEGHILNAFDKGANEQVSQGLDDRDRQWLKAYGPAQEFWHEAAHCLPEKEMRKRAMTPDEAKAIADVEEAGSSLCSSAGDNLSVIDKVSSKQNKDLDTVLLEAQATSSPKAKIALTRKKKGAGGASDTKKASPALPELTEESRQGAEEAFDNAQIIKLNAEALMDNLALTEINNRFPESGVGCNQSTHPTRPWNKLRLLWSIADPSPIYMTWLAPWLPNESIDVQRQMLADAWAGVRDAKKQVSDKVFYQDWVKQAGARSARNSLFRSPNGTPDPSRAKQWTQWLLSFTDKPSAIERAALQ